MVDGDLERVLAHTREWLASAAVRPIAPQVSIEDMLAILGGHCRNGASICRGDRRSRHRRRTQTYKHPVGTVLRLGHGRKPDCGPRCGPAGEHLGPAGRLAEKMLPVYLSVEEAAKVMSLSVKVIRRPNAAGTIPAD